MRTAGPCITCIPRTDQLKQTDIPALVVSVWGPMIICTLSTGTRIPTNNGDESILVDRRAFDILAPIEVQAGEGSRGS